ncbi:MAG: carbamoyltransferase HypF, partial [candidate division Zixibacteria bacterium]|nr:carbamoyltransferase HypF [candidate division Zixibacteria bacterium]
GLGGFQLIVDARNEDAVILLRHRKHREEKPLALMYPSMEMIIEDCEVDAVEKQLLTSAEAPIVFLRKKGNGHPRVSASVAPHNPYLGVMLPYTPLHHLLMRELNLPIVATSGNLSEEPICIDENEAVVRLGKIADLFLVHNRPIARQMDDSIARVIAGQPVVLRNARGYAPVTLSLNEMIKPCLAVGAHLKNTVAIAKDSQMHISQHIGDLETRLAREAHRVVTRSLAAIYDFEPETAACDLHPDYSSTGFARRLELPTVTVQHHYAHVLACLADNQLIPPALGVAWDGTGLGLDNTVWGGEFLLTDDTTFTRSAHLRTFRLPGGDRAVLEPRRAAIGLLYEIFGEDIFDRDDIEPLRQFSQMEKDILRKMLKHNLNAPVTSSVGRLFDSVASLIGLSHKNRFEGQAAMLLEHSIDNTETDDRYNFSIEGQRIPIVVDWESLVKEMLKDIEKKVSSGLISARFHNTMAEIIVAVAEKIGEKKVLLTGGCFQNKYLTEKASSLLERAGFAVYRHRRIPPNDGGIAAGQILAAEREQTKEK